MHRGLRGLGGLTGALVACMACRAPDGLSLSHGVGPSGDRAVSGVSLGWDLTKDEPRPVYMVPTRSVPPLSPVAAGGAGRKTVRETVSLEEWELGLGQGTGAPGGTGTPIGTLDALSLSLSTYTVALDGFEGRLASLDAKHGALAVRVWELEYEGGAVQEAPTDWVDDWARLWSLLLPGLASLALIIWGGKRAVDKVRASSTP